MESESEPENIDFIEQKLDPRVGSKSLPWLLICIVVGGSREFSTVGSQMRNKNGSMHSSRMSSSRLKSGQTPRSTAALAEKYVGELLQRVAFDEDG